MTANASNTFKILLGFIVLATVVFIVKEKFTTKTVELTDANGNKFTGEVKSKLNLGMGKSKPKPKMEVVKTKSNPESEAKAS